MKIRIHDPDPSAAASEARRIFQPYFRGTAAGTSGPPGSGLGLKLPLDFVEGKEGEFPLQGEPRQRSVFVVHLPVLDVPGAR